MKTGKTHERIYRWRKATLHYFCPLCRTERFSRMTPRLTVSNYFQICLGTVLFTALTYSVAKFSGLASFFVFWAVFEGVKRHWFKRELSCPHCGFNALRYKKDVSACRSDVLAFWQAKPIQK